MRSITWPLRFLSAGRLAICLLDLLSRCFAPQIPKIVTQSPIGTEGSSDVVTSLRDSSVFLRHPQPAYIKRRKNVWNSPQRLNIRLAIQLKYVIFDKTMPAPSCSIGIRSTTCPSLTFLLFSFWKSHLWSTSKSAQTNYMTNWHPPQAYLKKFRREVIFVR